MEKKTTKKKTAKSKTSSTPDTPGVEDMIKKLVGPLLKFHEKVEDAESDDLRIYWDVRLVRGEDEPFAQTSGSSTLPGMLSTAQLPQSPAMVQGEINDKIGIPITAKLQALASGLDNLPLLGSASDSEVGHDMVTEDPVSTDIAGDAMAHGAE